MYDYYKEVKKAVEEASRSRRVKEEYTMSCYLIPFAKTSSGIPLEYRLIKRKEDMRYTFCKKNKKHKINPLVLFSMVGEFQKDIRIKNNRLILLNGAAAYQVYNKLKAYRENGGECYAKV